MRIGAQATFRRWNLDQLQQLQRPCHRGRARAALVAHHGLGDLVADAVDRIERGHRLLEDHRDDGAAHGIHGALAQRQDVVLTDADAAADHRAARRMQPQDRAHRHRLARTGLADNAQHLARQDVERDAVDGGDRGLAADEIDRQVANFDQRAGRRGARRAASSISAPAREVRPCCDPTRGAPCDRPQDGRQRPGHLRWAQGHPAWASSPRRSVRREGSAAGSGSPTAG